MFAINSETRVAKFYEDAARNDLYVNAKESLLLFADQSKKNRLVLERIYKDSTASDGDVGAFTPIAGLTRNDYLVEAEITPGVTYRDFLTLAIDIEEKASRLYLDIARQVRSQGTRIVRSFERLAQERSSRKLTLKSLLKTA
jgi:hypothetical protein